MADTADRVVRFLIENACCSECDAGYHLEDVHVLNQVRGRIWDLAAVCHECYTLSLVRAIVRTPPDLHHASEPASAVDHLEIGKNETHHGADRSSVTVQELTAAERRRFRSLPPIDRDDVLDVTAFLASFDGDFRCLFSREPGDP